MSRTELERYILETYQADSDFPWKKYPAYQVFRHRRSRKWFALVMEVPENKLGREEIACLEVVNVKCEPAMIGALRRKAGFYPAYLICLQPGASSETNFHFTFYCGSYFRNFLKRKNCGLTECLLFSNILMIYVVMVMTVL